MRSYLRLSEQLSLIFLTEEHLSTLVSVQRVHHCTQSLYKKYSLTNTDQRRRTVYEWMLKSFRKQDLAMSSRLKLVFLNYCHVRSLFFASQMHLLSRGAFVKCRRHWLRMATEARPCSRKESRESRVYAFESELFRF